MPRQRTAIKKAANLIIGDAVVGGAVDEERDFFAGEFRGIAFLANNVNSAHEGGWAKLASRRVGRQSLCVVRRSSKDSATTAYCSRA